MVAELDMDLLDQYILEYIRSMRHDEYLKRMRRRRDERLECLRSFTAEGIFDFDEGDLLSFFKLCNFGKYGIPEQILGQNDFLELKGCLYQLFHDGIMTRQLWDVEFNGIGGSMKSELASIANERYAYAPRYVVRALRRIGYLPEYSRNLSWEDYLDYNSVCRIISREMCRMGMESCALLDATDLLAFISYEFGNHEGAEAWFLEPSDGWESAWDYGRDRYWVKHTDDEMTKMAINSISEGHYVFLKTCHTETRCIDGCNVRIPVMRIHAFGDVLVNEGDGRTLQIKWRPLELEWQYHVDREAVWHVTRGPEGVRWMDNQLLDFVFTETEQDKELFQRYFL